MCSTFFHDVAEAGAEVGVAPPLEPLVVMAFLSFA